VHTHDTAVRVRSVPRCAEIHYRTRTHAEPYPHSRSPGPSQQITLKIYLRVLGLSICHMEAKLVSSEYSEESHINCSYTSWFQTHAYEDCPPASLILLFILIKFGL
jgi:hypothetical protein